MSSLLPHPLAVSASICGDQLCTEGLLRSFLKLSIHYLTYMCLSSVYEKQLNSGNRQVRSEALNIQIHCEN